MCKAKQNEVVVQVGATLESDKGAKSTGEQVSLAAELLREIVANQAKRLIMGDYQSRQIVQYVAR